MKRLTTLCLAALVLALPTFMGCGEANDFGSSVNFEISPVDDSKSQPEVSISANVPLDVNMTIYNRTVNVIRTRNISVVYRAAGNNSIPKRIQEIAVDVPAGTPEKPGEATTLANIFNYEQMEYVRDYIGFLPDMPFSVSCAVTLFYDTIGGQTESVERQITITVKN